MAAPATARPTAQVELVERLGERTLVYARLADGLEITAEDGGDSAAQDRRPRRPAIDGAAAHLFGAGRRRRIMAERSRHERGGGWSGFAVRRRRSCCSTSCMLIFPLLLGIWLSFNRADLFGARQFVGARQLCAAGRRSGLRASRSGNTFKLALLIVPPLTILALLLALALNRATRGAAIFRGHLLLLVGAVGDDRHPDLALRPRPPTPACSPRCGRRSGPSRSPFLSDPEPGPAGARASPPSGGRSGLPMMLFLAGLQQIPGDIYEAAALDRCEPLDRRSGGSPCRRCGGPSCSSSCCRRRRSCSCSARRNC